MFLYQKLKNWLTLADYDAAKEEATRNIVARYARGNLSLKDGAYMDEAELQRLSSAGNAAAARLTKAAQSH